MWNQLLDSGNPMQMTANIGSWDVTPWNFRKTNQWMSVCSHSLLNIPSWNIKMLNGWALNLNDGEERCAQGTCPESGREDCHRPLNQNRSLEVIKGKKRPWKKKSQWPERSLIVSNCKRLSHCTYIKYHWCVLEMTVKTEGHEFGFAEPCKMQSWQ